MEIRKEDLTGLSRLTISLIKQAQVNSRRIDKSISLLENKKEKVIDSINQEIQINQEKKRLLQSQPEDFVKKETGKDLTFDQIERLLNGETVIIPEEDQNTESIFPEF